MVDSRAIEIYPTVPRPWCVALYIPAGVALQDECIMFAPPALLKGVGVLDEQLEAHGAVMKPHLVTLSH